MPSSTDVGLLRSTSKIGRRFFSDGDGGDDFLLEQRVIR